MKIRIGFEQVYEFPQPTPMILTLNVHASRAADLVQPDHIASSPEVHLHGYHDSYGNWWNQLLAPQDRLTLTVDTEIYDTGAPDPLVPPSWQHNVELLPTDTLLFLLPSRFCEVDLLMPVAWELFSKLPAGQPLVQAICDYVHELIRFDYMRARVTMTALEVYREKTGVCRDYTHLSITFCRYMNIPARYCTGYLSDIGMPPPYGTMDFAAWFEVYLGDQWHMFDVRNNKPCYGRVLIARGRDAADVALSSTFGPNMMTGFRVWADEVV